MRLMLPLNTLIMLTVATNSSADVLAPSDTSAGFVAMLLVNETPFPGEHKYVSEEDTKAAMLSILWVLHSRIDHIPEGYTQRQIASVASTNIIDVITVGGVHGQCEGFYRDNTGSPVAVKRVHERIARLEGLAAKGAPGRFKRLLEFAQGLASSYSTDGPDAADKYASINRIGEVEVTGRAYSWMTDTNSYAPGGNFVRISNEYSGAAGGNRFFTLRRLK